MASKTTIATLAFVTGAAAALAVDRLLRPRQSFDHYRLSYQLGRRLLDTLLDSIPPSQGIGQL